MYVVWDFSMIQQCLHLRLNLVKSCIFFIWNFTLTVTFLSNHLQLILFMIVHFRVHVRHLCILSVIVLSEFMSDVSVSYLWLYFSEFMSDISVSYLWLYISEFMSDVSVSYLWLYISEFMSDVSEYRLGWRSSGTDMWTLSTYRLLHFLCRVIAGMCIFNLSTIHHNVPTIWCVFHTLPFFFSGYMDSIWVHV